VRSPRRTLARILVPALAVTLLFPATLLLPTTPGFAGDTTGPCDLTRKAEETIQSKIERLIECATDRWEVSGGSQRAICVAEAESGLNPQAMSADGTHVGLYQHFADAWPDRFDAWARPHWNLNESALSGRSNAIVTIRMVNADGWGPWRGAGDCFQHGTRARGSLR
jgi:hypothetical protein